jgi:hypothetical protein
MQDNKVGEKICPIQHAQNVEFTLQQKKKEIFIKDFNILKVELVQMHKDTFPDKSIRFCISSLVRI